jgi:hypothetical protein
MQFYLPNFEDLVDPLYDFDNEQYSPDRKDRFTHDHYAHEFFRDERIFDGMLISKTIINSKLEQRIRAEGGLHKFYRLDKKIPIMGDCGAFSYRNKKRPPYTVKDIINYYNGMGFTYGVALDHLIFPDMPEPKRLFRQKLTLQNATEFIRRYRKRKRKLNFIPVGIIQGWDTESRCDLALKLIKVGYTHLAIGGMARSKDKEIRETLEALHAVIPSHRKLQMLHLFGVARLSLVPDFIRYGVTSADSAAPLRRAFLGNSEDNYWTCSGIRYGAIRVPEAKTGGSKKRGVASTESIMLKNGVSLNDLKEKEQKVLQLLRAYDKDQAGLEETLQAVLEYDQLHGDERDHAKSYRRTLQDRPWKTCGCPICEDKGIEVIIFRGNNRNRRRGFHNVKVFYDQFRTAIQQHSHEQSVLTG